MKRLSLYTLIFAVLSAVFFLLLIFLRIPFGPYPLMSNQDAIDILTPVVLIPLYWMLFRSSSSGVSHHREELVFMIFAALWVSGQGMHLSANSINNLSENLADSKVIDILNTSIYQLTYFYDEYLSHYLWHIGILGLAGLLIYREWRSPTFATTNWWLAGIGGVIYGLTSFLIFLEGNTVLMGLPFALITVLLILAWGRNKLSQKPVMAFFFCSYAVAIVLLAGWGLYFKGFPPPSAVGLI
jgi:hypothetical protein